MFVRHWYLLPPPTVAGRRVRQSTTVQLSAPALPPPPPHACSRADRCDSVPIDNMTNYIRIALVVCACVALTTAQYNLDYGLDYSDSFAPTNFGGPLLNTLSAAGARDPRANTGPVVFPPSPPGDPSQTSGVVVGASGYGFVPPGSQGPANPRYFYPGFFLGR
ncbi:uncharacterized protein LOC134650069 isoform X1 [Cydia amplana]|uniref:uncharacterized protein LOC134650069 isoform X1 n=2 Tax=Cydia amplana TaxID=1869771 RepID=UPI002FE534C4